MSDHSAIEWTDTTWNVVTGCTKVSPGCANCYIERTPPFRIHGRTFVNGHIPLEFYPARYSQPLHWRQPRRVFVNSLSDLFHESVPVHVLDYVFAIMALTPRHSYQILTKRSWRMKQYLDGWGKTDMAYRLMAMIDRITEFKAPTGLGYMRRARLAKDAKARVNSGPLPNAWMGVSVENNRWRVRVDDLLATPAAVRFISAEPLLEDVNLTTSGVHSAELCGCERDHAYCPFWNKGNVDWVIIGGESGPGARPCALEWIESIVRQCHAAGVACFVKQLGAYVVSEERTAPAEMMAHPARALLAPNGEAWAWRAGLKHKKGGDIAEFPDALRVRDFPEARV